MSAGMRVSPWPLKRFFAYRRPQAGWYDSLIGPLQLTPESGALVVSPPPRAFRKRTAIPEMLTNRAGTMRFLTQLSGQNDKVATPQGAGRG